MHGGKFSKSTYDLARTMFMTPGTTITQVSLALGISWHSAKQISTRVDTPLCGCGLESNHKGICSARSEEVNYAKVKEEIPTLNTTFAQEEEELSTGKCSELSCVFPAHRKGKCRQHYTDLTSPFSLYTSTWDSTYFFPDRHYTRKVIS